MISVYEATTKALEILEKVSVSRMREGKLTYKAGTELDAAASGLRQAIATFNRPDHVCPLCAQPKHQLELIEFLASVRNMEVWGDDGQSWTIDVTQCEGDVDKIVGLMLDVKEGRYPAPLYCPNNPDCPGCQVCA